MIAPKKVVQAFKIGTIMSKKYISEAPWSKISYFLKQCKKIYIKEEESCKNFIEAVFWMARTGAQWRELPENYGKWNSVFDRFNNWSKKQIWRELFEFCIQDPDLENVMIDATIVRAHACSAGYGNQETEGLGRTKGGFTSKIHAKVDALGNPLKFIITPGQRHDITQAEDLIKGTTNSNVLGDKGYDSKKLRLALANAQCEPVIPSKSNSKNPVEYDKHLYKERHAIECFFSKIKQFRRIFSRFDKSARNFASFLSFVGAFVWLR
jgi:transposase